MLRMPPLCCVRHPTVCRVRAQVLLRTHEPLFTLTFFDGAAAVFTGGVHAAVAAQANGGGGGSPWSDMYTRPTSSPRCTEVLFPPTAAAADADVAAAAAAAADAVPSTTDHGASSASGGAGAGAGSAGVSAGVSGRSGDACARACARGFVRRCEGEMLDRAEAWCRLNGTFALDRNFRRVADGPGVLDKASIFITAHRKVGVCATRTIVQRGWRGLVLVLALVLVLVLA